MFVVLWLGLHRGSGGSGPWNRSEVRSFRGFEVSRSGVGVEAWVWGPDLGVEVESVSLLRPSSSFSARVCSSGGPVPICQLDITVVRLVKSSFPAGQCRSTSGSPMWRRVRPRICGFVIVGPRSVAACSVLASFRGLI
ncbi:hypothetical protein Bca101_089887 [Brassica carinata]